MWLVGEPLVAPESANVLDIAPTILRLLGVATDGRHDGSTLVR